jgi:hypothetical protein
LNSEYKDHQKKYLIKPYTWPEKSNVERKSIVFRSIHNFYIYDVRNAYKGLKHIPQIIGIWHGGCTIDIESVKKKYEERLLRLPNVIGIGIGIGERSGKQVIKVFVTQKLPVSDLEPNKIIPKILDEYEIDVEEIGTVIAQNNRKFEE